MMYCTRTHARMYQRLSAGAADALHAPQPQVQQHKPLTLYSSTALRVYSHISYHTSRELANCSRTLFASACGGASGTLCRRRCSGALSSDGSLSSASSPGRGSDGCESTASRRPHARGPPPPRDARSPPANPIDAPQ